MSFDLVESVQFILLHMKTVFFKINVKMYIELGQSLINCNTCNYFNMCNAHDTMIDFHVSS